MRTRLLLAIPGLVVAQSAASQTTGGNDAAAAVRRSFNEVSSYVTRAADMVPADKYSYRPTQSVRTFGQLVAHIADAHTGKLIRWSATSDTPTCTTATSSPTCA
jgi:hypothetical protein